MFLECFGILLLTIAAGTILSQIPGLNYGWTNIFYQECGNIAVQPIMEGSQSNNIAIRLMVPFFFLALAFVLPFLARIEENIFRKGSQYSWLAIIKQSIIFGLFHCIVGISIAFGLALSIPGFFYGFKYKKHFDRNEEILDYSLAEEEAILVSTTYHTMYNMIAVILLIIIAITMI